MSHSTHFSFALAPPSTHTHTHTALPVSRDPPSYFTLQQHLTLTTSLLRRQSSQGFRGAVLIWFSSYLSSGSLSLQWLLIKPLNVRVLKGWPHAFSFSHFICSPFSMSPTPVALVTTTMQTTFHLLPADPSTLLRPAIQTRHIHDPSHDLSSLPPRPALFQCLLSRGLAPPSIQNHTHRSHLSLILLLCLPLS